MALCFWTSVNFVVGFVCVLIRFFPIPFSMSLHFLYHFFWLQVMKLFVLPDVHCLLTYGMHEFIRIICLHYKTLTLPFTNGLFYAYLWAILWAVYLFTWCECISNWITLALIWKLGGPLPFKLRIWCKKLSYKIDTIKRVIKLKAKIKKGTQRISIHSTYFIWWGNVYDACEWLCSFYFIIWMNAFWYGGGIYKHMCCNQQVTKEHFKLFTKG